MRRTTLFLRLLGLLAAIGGVTLWWYGGKDLTVNYKDAAIPVPLDLGFIILGLLLLLVPVLFIYVIACFVPSRNGRARLVDYANRLDPVKLPVAAG